MGKCLVLILLGVTSAPAQVIDATHIGDSVPLQGYWRFHTGDNPDFARRDLNDSKWPLIMSNKNLDQQGLEKLRGYVWCRVKVKLPANHGPLYLERSDMGPSEVYIDGQRLDTTGRFPPNPTLVREFPKVLLLPEAAGEMTVALRYWIPPIFEHIGNIANDLVLGQKDTLDRDFRVTLYGAAVRLIPYFVVQAFRATLFVGFLVLFFLQRDRTEYFFLAIALLGGLVGGINDDISRLTPAHLIFSSYINTAGTAISAVAMVEFVFRFLGERMPVWFRIYQFAIPLFAVGIGAFWAGWISQSVINVGLVFYLMPYWLLTPGFVIWRFLHGNKEAGLLAIPITLLMLNDMLNLVGGILYYLKLHSTPVLIGDLTLGGVVIAKDVLFSFLFLLGIAGLILYRFQRTRLEQTRANAELEAARTMQELMVPKSVLAPGFEIEIAYIPAQEVGGDFFQFFPCKDGSLLVVIGDVSGKGLKAAMLVNMILGLLRRTIDLTRSPGQILGDVNRLLIGYTGGKFATCCCALLAPGGRVVAANAGHLSPYCDGNEIELICGLPLGLSADTTYEEVTLAMQSSKRWVFLSDGVVEARNKSGELYGFDRTRTISTQAANEIAKAAEEFGQDDDITVLGIVALA